MNEAVNIMTNWHRSQLQNKDHTMVSSNEETTQGAGSNLPNQESALCTSSSFRVAKSMQMFGTSKE